MFSVVLHISLVESVCTVNGDCPDPNHECIDSECRCADTYTSGASNNCEYGKELRIPK